MRPEIRKQCTECGRWFTTMYSNQMTCSRPETNCTQKRHSRRESERYRERAGIAGISRDQAGNWVGKEWLKNDLATGQRVKKSTPKAIIASDIERCINMDRLSRIINGVLCGDLSYKGMVLWQRRR